MIFYIQIFLKIYVMIYYHNHMSTNIKYYKVYLCIMIYKCIFNEWNNNFILDML